jgi:metal-responsive CopG/Arc/MetJ family transcriptional regulator
MSTLTMQKVMITVPPTLLGQIDEAVARLNTSRSALFRQAMEFFFAEQQRQELRELLAEGYRVHAERDLRICEEFAAADYEALANQETHLAGTPQP